LQLEIKFAYNVLCFGNEPKQCLPFASEPKFL